MLEAESYSKLEHPNIVPVLEVGEQDGMPFLCMELIDGVTIDQIAAREPMPNQSACEIARKVCSAIQHAHDQGVFHRDLKPSNIIIDKHGEPYVLDFGLAKLDESNRDLTKTGMIIGTPSFISPEQATGQRELTSFATDVYGIGAILYFMLTCQPPFRGASSIETIMKVIEQPPVPPRSLNPLVEKDVELIVQTCLQKSMHHRYPTAQALSDDLDAYASEQPLLKRGNVLATAVGNVLRETHHVNVLANWGIIWMWHSVFILLQRSQPI